MKKVLQLEIESQGWTTDHKENTLLISRYSPAGEDFYFYVNGESTEELISNICKYANDFDIDEHTSMHIENRGKSGIPSSVSVLVKDAEDIKDMLKELADAVKKIKEV
ncbi:MAG TPA: hypothetical protein GX530_08895 [Corynebacteriales bacterium]|nr:hypothetical protein [Mycobacteriales bacterium]